MRAAGTRHSGMNGPYCSPVQSMPSNSSHSAPRIMPGRDWVSASRREASLVTGDARKPRPRSARRALRRHRSARAVDLSSAADAAPFRPPPPDRLRRPLRDIHREDRRIRWRSRFAVSIEPRSSTARSALQHGRGVNLGQRAGTEAGKTSRSKLVMTSSAWTGPSPFCRPNQARAAVSRTPPVPRRAPFGRAPHATAAAHRTGRYDHGSVGALHRGVRAPRIA